MPLVDINVVHVQHHTVSGHYMYIEASDHVNGDYADLDTPTIQSSSAYCLTFWYHMYGQHIGSLTVLAVSSSGNTQEVWTRTREGRKCITPTSVMFTITVSSGLAKFMND